MSYINCKFLWAVALVAVLMITGTEIRVGRTQTNLQAIQDRVAGLERKLADAKARQEKAQSIQKKLEEQEQKLAGLEHYLSESDKYRIQVIEIRMNIKSIRARIEAIEKERNDLEDNLQLAKNLQTIMLQEIKSTSSMEPKAPTNIDPLKAPYWQINNIKITDHFDKDEREEIMRIFSSGSQFNQDDLLNISHNFYNKTGTVIHFIIHKKTGNYADLEIILNQRTRHSPTHFSSFPTRNIFEFKANYFRLKIVND